MEILDKIRLLRHINKLTQGDVATGIGIARSNYSKYENGERNFTIEHIKKLAQFYNVSLTYFFDDSYDIVISKDDLLTLTKANEIITSLLKAYNSASMEKQKIKLNKK